MGKITLEKDGRIAIPKEKRKALGLEPDMTIQLERRGEELAIRKAFPISEFMVRLHAILRITTNNLILIHSS